VLLDRVEDAYFLIPESGEKVSDELVIVYRKQELAFEIHKAMLQAHEIFI
jgi:hypothetical protein